MANSRTSQERREWTDSLGAKYASVPATDVKAGDVIALHGKVEAVELRTARKMPAALLKGCHKKFQKHLRERNANAELRQTVFFILDDERELAYLPSQVVTLLISEGKRKPIAKAKARKLEAVPQKGRLSAFGNPTAAPTTKKGQ